jgi:hypothetical protein
MMSSNLLGYNAVQSVENQLTFRGNMPPPSPALLANCFMLLSCLAYSSTLKMKAQCTSETLVDFQHTTRRYIPEDGTFREPFDFLNAYSLSDRAAD